jgi:hypothetical protein
MPNDMQWGSLQHANTALYSCHPRYLPFGNILGKFAENVAPPIGPPTEDATFVAEGAILASPECSASPNKQYLLCLRRDSRLQLVHSTARGNYTMW